MQGLKFKIRMAGLLTLTLVAQIVHAQQQGQDQQSTQSQDAGTAPIPAYHSPLAGLSDNGNTTVNSDQMQPDTRSLAGAQDLSIGSLPTTHSYWEPHFDFTTTADSNPLDASGTSGWTTWTSLLAGLDLHRISGNTELTLNYMGGGEISTNGESSNSVLQQFGFNDKISWHRTTLTILDQLNYVPDVTIGYGALSGLNLPGGGSLGLQQGFIPGQSILTPEGERLTNSFVMQDDAYLTPRSSLTFVGGYSLLHYYGDDLLNMGDAIFQGGYNYQASGKDTFAIFYRFSAYRYGNFGQSINDNTLQLSYGRRVTGKLAFQVAAGPEIAFLELPITQTGTTTGGTGGAGSSSPTASGSTRQVYWALNSQLTYQFERTGYELSYNHGLSGGSGVLAGSVSDWVSGTVTRQLSREVAGSVNFGYSRNSGVNYGGAMPSNQTYNNLMGGANLSRPFGRDLKLSLSYELQYQNSNTPFCIGTVCESNLTRNMITVSFGWHSRPLTY